MIAIEERLLLLEKKVKFLENCLNIHQQKSMTEILMDQEEEDFWQKAEAQSAG